MPTPSYTVETRKQCALVLGSDNWLCKSLKSEIEGRGIKVFNNLKDVGDDYDLDYCLSLGVPLPTECKGMRSVYLVDVEHVGQIPTLPAETMILIYPDLIGPHIELSGYLQGFLTTLLTEKTLRVKGEGLDKYYLLHEQDLVAGAVEILLGGSDKKVIYLADPDSPSTLSFAYQVRSTLNFKVELVFDQGRGLGEGANLEEYLLVGFSPSFRTTDHLQSFIKSKILTLSSIKNTQKKPAVHTVESKVDLKPGRTERHLTPLFVPIAPKSSGKIHRKPPTTKPRSPIVVGILLGLALYLTSIIFALTLTFLTGRRILTTFSTYTIPSSSFLTLAGSSAKYLEINLIAVSSLPILNKSSALKDITLLLSTYEHGIETAKIIVSLSGVGKDLMTYVLGGGELDINSLLERAKLETGTLYEKLSLLDAELGADPPQVLPARYEEKFREIKLALADGRKAALTGKTILGTAPDLLGIGSRRKYLVLFQNNMELRATGGFIGSFALLSFENGHLYDMPIYDVYSADGALKGHVEPPSEIKEYLGEANWYLRDSNWDPDFITSARRAEWFLKKTIGTDVQGTIGINIYTLSNVLRALGGVELPDYGEKITADNIFERAEYHSEVNFFPGSTGKKEFLSSTASSVFNSLHNLSLTQTLGVVRAIAEGIDTKNTLLSISSPTTARIFSTLGWDGSIRDPQCPDLGQGSCLSDYLYLVESNFGVNKANYFLERSLSDDINVSDSGEITHNLNIAYTNKATSGTWPAGNYKNYLRLYLPASSTVTSVKVGEVSLPVEEFKIYAEHGKTVVGFLVEVPISTSVGVNVEYRLGKLLEGANPIYSFYWQKQSGIGNDPLTIHLNYPSSFSPDIISPRASLGQGQLGFGLTTSTDRRITVKFK